MRSTLCGLGLIAFLLFFVFVGGDVPTVLGQRPGGAANANSPDSLVTHSVQLVDGRQQITVIDTRVRSIAVYQLDPRTGAISLKSVRNMHWDLQMDDFNSGGDPSPRDIRTLLEQR